MSTHFLEKFFSPASVAVFGANGDPDTVGGRVYRNLREGGFPGALWAINPKHDHIGAQRCFADLAELGATVELAVIATPAATVPDIIRDCGRHGVRAAIIISAGFRDAPGQSVALEQSLLSIAHEEGVRLLGPNCLGLARPAASLNATFTSGAAPPGNLAFVSQSGALCTAVLDWAQMRGIGFSAVVSLGEALDVDFGAALDYLAMDEATHAIMLYVEGIRDARGFMSGLRAAARIKPVLVLKVGRHATSARAALSHTGALVGSDEVFDAALQRVGAVRVADIEQLFNAASLLTQNRRLPGSRLAIVTNGGGPGIMASDRAADLGIPLAPLSNAMRARLDAVLPPHWSGGNPIDLLGDASPSRYQHAVKICLDDPEVDVVLVLLTPQAMTQPEVVAAALIDLAAHSDKLLLTSWMGDRLVATSRHRFATRGIASFDTPEAAIEALHALDQQRRNRQLMLQVPGPLAARIRVDVAFARGLIDATLARNESLLSRVSANAILNNFGIPTIPLQECADREAAVAAAQVMGYPVAMKINSPDISHKTDVDGVILNLSDAGSVRHAFDTMLANVLCQRPEARLLGVTIEKMYQTPHARELMAGVVRDPVFGPVIVFGAGGTMVEFIRDRAAMLPPLNSVIIHHAIERTRVAALLGQFRNHPPVDREAVLQVLRQLSELVCELPQVREIDLNPLVVSDRGAMVLDARMVVDEGVPGTRPYGHMAIHPYPAHLVSDYVLADGQPVVIRPIRPEDAALESAFIAGLSESSRYFRFMYAVKKLTPEMLVRFTSIDYDREMALVGVIGEGQQERDEKMIAVARYVVKPDQVSCEMVIVVADAWVQRGIGYQLISRLIDIARNNGLRTMEAEVLADNRRILELARSLKFTVQPKQSEPGILQLSRTLS